MSGQSSEEHQLLVDRDEEKGSVQVGSRSAESWSSWVWNGCVRFSDFCRSRFWNTVTDASLCSVFWSLAQEVGTGKGNEAWIKGSMAAFTFTKPLETAAGVIAYFDKPKNSRTWMDTIKMAENVLATLCAASGTGLVTFAGGKPFESTGGVASEITAARLFTMAFGIHLAVALGEIAYYSAKIPSASTEEKARMISAREAAKQTALQATVGVLANGCGLGLGKHATDATGITGRPIDATFLVVPTVLPTVNTLSRAVEYVGDLLAGKNPLSAAFSAKAAAALSPVGETATQHARELAMSAAAV